MEVVSAADAASSTIVFENEEAACVAIAVSIKDESAQNDQEDTNKEDPLDEEEDNIATLNTRSISNEDPISSQDNPSNFCHRLCCCIKGCTWQKLLTIAFHTIIMILALLCFIPTGVMVSVMRAKWANVATLIWIIYCIVVISTNISYYFHARRQIIVHDSSQRNSRYSGY